MKLAVTLIVLLLSYTITTTDTFGQSSPVTSYHGIIVYENGGTYYAIDSKNNVLVSSTIAETAIRTALARGGEIFVGGGTYNLSNGFSGFDITSDTHLNLSADTRIVVPSGYSGYVFRFYGGAIPNRDSILQGGQISEADPVKRNWIAILMQGGTPHGVFFNYIENMVITDPYIVIDFSATTGQWINANTFVNIHGTTFVRGIEFDFKGSHLNNDGFDGNTFKDLQFQSGPMTAYGAKDIQTIDTYFFNVQFWDLPSGAISTSIDPTASSTVIVGGLMTYGNFIDKGTNTIILDSWHGALQSSNATISSEIIKGTYQPAVHIPTLPTIPTLNASTPRQPTGTTVNSTGPTGENNTTFQVQIKNEAKSWSQGKISDDSFGTSIQNLVAAGILEKPNQPQTTSKIIIPQWFKTNAGWWADGQISASDFISATQYLLDSGLIQIPLG